MDKFGRQSHPRGRHAVSRWQRSLSLPLMLALVKFHGENETVTARG